LCDIIIISYHKIQGIPTVVRGINCVYGEIQLALGQRIPEIIGRVEEETVVAKNAIGEEGK
jgi:hypothetical protein